MKPSYLHQLQILQLYLVNGLHVTFFSSLFQWQHFAFLYFWFPEQSTTLGFSNLEQWIGCFLYLLTFGASFSAIGIFSSSITNNQMVAGMLTFTLLTLYLSIMAVSFGEISDTQIFSGFSQFLWSCIGSMFHGLNKMQNFSVGLIEIQTILHQFVVIFYFLFLASIQVDRMRK